MGSVQQIRVKWNNHQSNFPKVFDNLLHKKEFVDVTLACEGQSLKAHKVVLSACSPYFHTLFVENPCQHPIVIMRDFRYCEIEAVVEYMYKGEVNISRDSLREFLRTAQSLQVKGLADDESGETNNDGVDTEESTYTPQQNRVPDPEPELRPQSRISRPAVIEQTNISHETYSHSQPSPAVSREHFSAPSVVKRDSFSHSAPKRMRISEKPTTLPPQTIENTPSQSAVSYQSIASIPPTDSEESAPEIIETPIKIEMKPFDVAGFENTQDSSALDESQDIDQGLDSPEPDTIVLGDDPEILEDEPEIMFAHDSSSQEAGLSQDDLTSNLLSVLRDSGSGPSMSSPQQGTGEGFQPGVVPSWPGSSSKLWKYFEPTSSMEYRVLCYTCGCMIARSLYSNGKTYKNSNLVQHLKRCHPQQFMEYKGHINM